MNQQLLDFIKRQIESGQSREDITRILISQGGWTEVEVKDAFTSFSAPVNAVSAQSLATTPAPPTMPEANVKTAWHDTQAHGVYKSRPTKGLRVSTTATLVVLFLLLAGGAMWGFFVYFPNLIKPKPEEAIARSFQALITAPMIHVEGNLHALGTFESINRETQASSTATSTRAIKGDYDLKLGFVSTIDRHVPSDPKVTLSLSPDISVKIPPLAFDLSAVVDTRSINRVLYVQLRSMSDLLFPLDLARLKGVWIRLEPNEYTQLTSLSEDQQSTLWKKINESGAFNITQELPIVKESGVRYRHYAFTIDRSKLVALITELNNIPGVATNTASLALLPSPTGEVWISSADYFPHKLILTYKLDGAQTDLSSIGETKLSGTITFETKFSRDEGTGSVVEPVDTSSLSDIIDLLENSDQASSTGSGTPVR